jgi:hypothetical protein
VASDSERLRVLEDRTALEAFNAAVESIPSAKEPIRMPGAALVAGCGLDLSGSLDCIAWECRKKQVDQLFQRVWHYFDRVVVVGPEPRGVPDSDTDEGFLQRDNLESDLRLLAYLREIGAEPLISFRTKPAPCTVHIAEHAEEAELSAALPAVEELGEEVAASAEISYEWHEDHVHYQLNHELFEHTRWDTAWPPSRQSSESAIRRSIGIDAVGRYLAHLTADKLAADALAAPLGATVRLHRDLLRRAMNVDDIEVATAFELKLPILEGIDLRTLLELREKEREHFERFRVALRTAVRERIRNRDSPHPTKVAAEIESDVIVPALNDISLRLRTAQQSLERKGKFASRLGALLTTCGVVLGQPWLAAAGVGTGGVLLQAINKDIDDERDLQLNDMYFLWQAAGHASLHGR